MRMSYWNGLCAHWINLWSSLQQEERFRSTADPISSILWRSLKKQLWVRANIAHRRAAMVLWQRIHFKSMESEAMLWNQDTGTVKCIFTGFQMLLVWRPFWDVNFLRLCVSELHHHWGCYGIQAFDKHLLHFGVIIRIVLGNATKALSLTSHIQ